jgi:hypothetical protein
MTGHEPLPFEQHGQDLTDALEEAKERGYSRNFAYRDHGLCCQDTGEAYAEGQAWIADSISVDMGTDPGDDSTVYLIDTEGGRRGYVVVPASIYAEPGKAAFIDRLKSHPRSSPR